MRCFLAAAGLLSLGACAMPLGPGYTIERQQIEVRYVAAPAPHLAVRATYRLLNTGNQPLSSLEVSFAEETSPARQTLRATVDGREAVLQPAADRGPGAFRIPLESPWPQKQKRELALSYELTDRAGKDSRISWNADAFYLASGWQPRLLPPKGTFSKGGDPPDKWDLSVIVPADFLAHASGRARGERRQGAELAHRFEHRAGDLEPFVVAGRYQEQKVRSREGEVIFWTSQPLPAGQAARAAQHILATMKALEAAFGLRSQKHGPVWIVSAAERLPALDVKSWKAASFPDGALFDPQWFVSGSADNASLCVLDVVLAGQWLEQVTRPDEQARDLSFALANYAAAMAAEGCAAEIYGTPDRNQAVRNFLRAFRKSQEEASQRLGNRGDSAREQAEAARAQLFVCALEDRVGKEHLNKALRRMMQALRGRSWGIEGFRSALEGEAGQNLGEFFRRWFNEPNVPEDFRARYEEKDERSK